MRAIKPWWRYLLVLCALLLVTGLAAAFLPAYRQAVLFFWFTCISNSVIPAPYEAGLLYFAQYYPPLLTATVAAAGTLVPCFLDYRAIHGAFQTRRFCRIRESDAYQGAVHYFLKAPFLTITLAAFAPFIPFYIFRVLSPTSGYSLKRYMAAVFVGRLPRYYLFALMGYSLIPSKLIPIAGAILIVCLYLCFRVKRHLANLNWETPGTPGYKAIPVAPPNVPSRTDTPS